MIKIGFMACQKYLILWCISYLFLVFQHSAIAHTDRQLWQLYSDDISSTRNGHSMAAYANESVELDQIAADAFHVVFHFDLLKQLSSGDSFLLELPSKKQPLLFIVSSVEQKANSLIVYAQYDKVRVILTSQDQRLFGTVISPTGIWRLIVSEGQGQLQLQSDPRRHHNEVPSLPNDYLYPPRPPTPESFKQTQTIDPRVDTNKLAILDAYIVFNQPASHMYQGQAELRIQHLVAVTNDIFRNSGVQIIVNPIAIEQVSYNRHVSSAEALRDITGDGLVGILEEARQRKQQLGVDIMIFLRPYADDQVCGMAWLNKPPFMARYLVSHVSIDCTDDVMAHEIGHNLGLTHSRRQDGQGYSFPFATGYGVDSNFTTVMAYPNSFSSAYPLFTFSSPKLLCFGLPCGVDHKDTSLGADAVLALNKVRFEAQDIAERQLNSFTLSIESLGIENLTIEVSGIASQSIPFQLEQLSSNSKLTIIAPLNHGEFQLYRWHGCDVTFFQNCQLIIEGNRTIQVEYRQSTDDLGQALTTPEFIWQTKGDQPWFVQNDIVFDYQEAVQSGPINHSQSSILEASFYGAGTLNFHWKVSSEAHFDHLTLYINDEQYERISGEVDWQRVELQLKEQAHHLRWEYTKDRVISDGSDTAWLAGMHWQPASDRAIVSIELPGSGEGLVVSEPSGIHCRERCNHIFTNREPITLTATAKENSIFLGWQGGCTHQGAQCILSLNSSVTTQALFVQQDYHQVIDIIYAKSGNGHVTPLTPEIFRGFAAEFLLEPKAGYQVRRKVTGSCPPGQWLGAKHYQTGMLNEDCSVEFVFFPLNRKPVWWFITGG